MAGEMQYYRNDAGKTTTGPSAADVFANWQGANERWLFLSAHDDDIVCGAGLLLAAALAEGIESHAVITSDGRMGYCSDEQRLTIANVRRKETEDSFRIMGLPLDRLHFLGFPDGNLGSYVGRREAKEGDAGAVAGYTGLENSYVRALRQIRPTRVIMPTSADLHPDHKFSNMEMQISLYHACGEIWPELGKQPLTEVPAIYEYACYCDFPEMPQFKLVTSPRLLEMKMSAIRAYASQRQIEAGVELLRQAGPVEYYRKLNFRPYSPKNYEGIF